MRWMLSTDQGVNPSYGWRAVPMAAHSVVPDARNSERENPHSRRCRLQRCGVVHPVGNSVPSHRITCQSHVRARAASNLGKFMEAFHHTTTQNLVS